MNFHHKNLNYPSNVWIKRNKKKLLIVSMHFKKLLQFWPWWSNGINIQVEINIPDFIDSSVARILLPRCSRSPSNHWANQCFEKLIVIYTNTRWLHYFVYIKGRFMVRIKTSGFKVSNIADDRKSLKFPGKR